MKSHTAKTVEAQVKAAAPELTKLAKHRVALAYALACGNKTASTSTARRRMVEAFLTMPTFALQSLYDMHSASTKQAAEEDVPEHKEEDAAPEGEGAPAPEGEGAPAPEGEGAPEGDLGGDLGGGDLGGMDLGGGAGGGMGAPAAPESSPEASELKAENEALVGDIQKLESDVTKLQEVLPGGAAVDLSALLSDSALDSKAADLPAGAATEGEEDPALDLMPEGGEGEARPFNPMGAGEEEGMPKSASRFNAEDSEDNFEVALLNTLQGVDKGEQSSDPALPEPVEPILDQVDVEEPEFIDLPENILSDLAPAAGVKGGGPAMPKAAATKKVASVSTGARFLPSGTVRPASPDDQQVNRLSSLLNEMWS